MSKSIETREIMFAFAVENKDNIDSWGKYVLEELQDAYDDMSGEERASTTGQRILARIKELENPPEKVAPQEEDEVEDDIQHDQPVQQGQINNQQKPIIIGGTIAGIIILILGIFILT